MLSLNSADTGASVADYIYAGNAIEFGNTSSDGTVTNVTISDIFDSGITPQTYDDNQTATNFTFSNMIIDKCGLAGIEIAVLDNGGKTGSSISNVSVTDSAITNSGNGWSGNRYGDNGIGAKIVTGTNSGTLSGISLNNVTISGSSGDGIYIGGETGEVTISRSKIKSNANYGVRVAGVAGIATIKLTLQSSLIYSNTNPGVWIDAPNGDGFNIYHNTFYNNGNVNVGIQSHSGSANIINNIFYNTLVSHLYIASTLSSADVDYNCYNDRGNMISYNATSYATIIGFRATGFEANGTGTDEAATFISLTNPGGEDLTLQTNSSCKTLGMTGIGISTDYLGTSYINPPSSGAYQF